MESPDKKDTEKTVLAPVPPFSYSFGDLYVQSPGQEGYSIGYSMAVNVTSRTKHELNRSPIKRFILEWSVPLACVEENQSDGDLPGDAHRPPWIDFCIQAPWDESVLVHPSIADHASCVPKSYDIDDREMLLFMLTDSDIVSLRVNIPPTGEIIEICDMDTVSGPSNVRVYLRNRSISVAVLDKDLCPSKPVQKATRTKTCPAVIRHEVRAGKGAEGDQTVKKAVVFFELRLRRNCNQAVRYANMIPSGTKKSLGNFAKIHSIIGDDEDEEDEDVEDEPPGVKGK